MAPGTRRWCGLAQSISHRVRQTFIQKHTAEWPDRTTNKRATQMLHGKSQNRRIAPDVAHPHCESARAGRRPGRRPALSVTAAWTPKGQNICLGSAVDGPILITVCACSLIVSVKMYAGVHVSLLVVQDIRNSFCLQVASIPPPRAHETCWRTRRRVI